MAVPKQRNLNAEKADLRAGRIPEVWKDKTGQAVLQGSTGSLDVEVHEGEAAGRQDDGTMPATDLAISFFGYKSHVSIDWKFRLSGRDDRTVFREA